MLVLICKKIHIIHILQSHGLPQTSKLNDERDDSVYLIHVAFYENWDIRFWFETSKKITGKRFSTVQYLVRTEGHHFPRLVISQHNCFPPSLKITFTYENGTTICKWWIYYSCIIINTCMEIEIGIEWTFLQEA